MTIVRKAHAFDGQSLAAIGTIRRRGVLFVLVSLPDGNRSLIPAEWTDWDEPGRDHSLSPDHDITANCFARLHDLLQLRKVLDALQSRLGQPALPMERRDAANTLVSRSPGSTVKDVDTQTRFNRLGRHRRGIALESAGDSDASHRPDACRRSGERGKR